jgi:hypothetical protein
MAETSWKSLHKAGTTVLEGEFPVIVHKAEAGQSQNGKTMIKCQLKVESGPYAGRTISHNFTFSPENPNAVAFFFSDLALLGADDKFFETDPNTSDIAQRITGARATALLEKNNYQGRDREQVKRFSAPGAGGPFVATSGFPAATALPQASSLPAAGSAAPPKDPF